jgi:O-antigen ligase
MNGRIPLLSLLLAAILMLGILFAWPHGIWAISILQVGLFALGIAVAVLAFVNPSQLPTLPPLSVLLPLVVVALWAPLQLLLGTTVYAFPTWLATLYWLTDLVAFILAVLLLQRSRPRVQFLSILMYFGAAVVVVSILQSFTSPYHVFWMFESNYRVIGPFIYKNQFAAFVELILPIALYRMLTDRKNSLVFAFLSAVMFAAVLASASRMGTALLSLEVLVVLLAGWRKGLVSVRNAGALFAQVLILLVICAAVIGWEEMGIHFQDETSGNLRLKFLQSSLHMIRDYPWIGVGLGNWTTVYPSYALFDNGLFANAAHNDWAQWAAEGGIPFAALLLWIFGAATVSAWRNPWGIGVVSVLIHSFLDYPTREPVIGAILFCLLGAMLSADMKISDARIIPMKSSEKPVRSSRVDV